MIVSARGMLSREALERKPWRKRVFLTLLEFIGLERSAVLHATSEPERQDIGRAFPDSRILVVPNGVDVPDIDSDATARGRAAVANPYFLYLGRLDRHKQIERILEAFGLATSGRNGSWRLVIAGDGDASYESELRTLARSLGVDSHVDFTGFIAGDRKDEILSSAGCLVLASKSENFGMSAAESLAAGAPVIATNGTPWQALETHGCGLWVEDSVAALERSMRTIMGMSREERREMGARGREWVSREFAWSSVGATVYVEMSRLAGSNDGSDSRP
jgi:glycosyltransferase involved in cell wall biosynthesis